MPNIDAVLEGARKRFVRVSPSDAAREAASGALLVDTRPREQREADGLIPGAIVIDRNVLEWRLDPASPARIEQAVDHDIRVIIVCNEGYSSSLVAASLHDLGLRNATDVIGGFQAWRAADLPVTTP
jgi:rhodanese-related sulfurtransferase